MSVYDYTGPPTPRDSALACASCGSTELWAWYPEPTRQTIEAWQDEDGSVRYDYTGSTTTGDDSGPDDSYMCGGCGTFTETIEALVGLPVPPQPTSDADALDRMNRILSAPDWSVGMLEDLCAILRSTGREAVESDYIRH